jgi:hypothetical protein
MASNPMRWKLGILWMISPGGMAVKPEVRLGGLVKMRVGLGGGRGRGDFRALERRGRGVSREDAKARWERGLLG